MKIKNYDQFLLESIVYSSPDFINILKLMKDEDKIADTLLKLLDNDIKTNYNFIKISDETGKLLFVPDNQASRKLSQGATKEEIFSVASNPTTVGRLVKSIFNSNSIPVNDGGLEIFGNRFKALMELKLNPNVGVSIVKGLEIKQWYLEDFYAGKETRQGTLNKSCMRHEDCQEFFDIYTENPDVVSMVIKTNMSGELEARALLWQTDKGLYLDRVYFTKEIYNNLIIDWVQIKFGETLTWRYSKDKRITVKLKPHLMYEYFPYLDSLCYYTRETDEELSAATLTNFLIDTSDENLNRAWYCQDTEGGAERQNMLHSEFYGIDIPRSEAVFSDRYDSYIPASSSFYSNHYQDYLPNEFAVWSDKLDSYLDKNVCNQVIIDKEGNKDWYPRDDRSLKTFVEEISQDIYDMKLKDSFYELNGKFYDLEKGRFVKLVYDTILTYKVYGRYNLYCTELDEKVFKIKTEGNPVIISDLKYFSLYGTCKKKEFIEIINAQDVSNNLKKQKIEEFEEAHEYLMENDDYYRTRNSS